MLVLVLGAVTRKRVYGLLLVWYLREKTAVDSPLNYAKRAGGWKGREEVGGAEGEWSLG